MESTQSNCTLILCVGALGAGKSTLLKMLQQHGQELAMDKEEVAASKEKTKEGITPVTTPTMGTDLLTVTQCSRLLESIVWFHYHFINVAD